jgi:hypothetical protein
MPGITHSLKRLKLAKRQHNNNKKNEKIKIQIPGIK